jgi:ankyrin repeat protein
MHMYNGWTKDPPVNRLCSALQKLIGALNTGGKPFLITWRTLEGKGKAYLFIAQNVRYLCIDCGAAGKSDVFSRSAITCTLNIWALYVLYDLYGSTTCTDTDRYHADLKKNWRLYFMIFQDMLGNTALHLAACTNHVPVVTLLLRYRHQSSFPLFFLQLFVTRDAPDIWPAG